MTREEAANYFHIREDRLRYYEESGLLEQVRRENGEAEYGHADGHRLCLICTLLEAGMDPASLRRYLSLEGKGGPAREEQLRLLKQQRFRLLEDIHGRQKLLDCLDHIICQVHKCPADPSDKTEGAR